MNENERMRRVLSEVQEHLSGCTTAQLAVLKREKEEQVCAQNFAAAAELHQQIKEHESYWSRASLLARVIAAQPVRASSRDAAARELLQAVEAAGSWLSAALDDPKSCGAVKGAFRAVLDAAETALREGVGNV